MPDPYDDAAYSRGRRHRDRRAPPRDDLADDDYYRPSTKSRDLWDDEPKLSGTGSRRRRHDHDASDKEDPVRRRHDKKGSAEPDIPPPPIGDDRKSSSRKKALDDDGPLDTEAATKLPSDNEEGTAEEEAPRPRQESRSSRDHGARDRSHDAPPAMPEPARSSRNRHDDKQLPHRSKGRYDEEDKRPPPREESSRRRRYDEQPRRSKYEDDRRRPSRQDDTRRRRPAYPQEDSEPEYEKPKRRVKPSRYEDGYGTDRPRRQPRDDYDRGYRTDGREAKRERYRDDDRRPPPPRRDDRYRDDYDDYDRGYRGSRRKSNGHKLDMDEIVAKGQENWKKVAPVAKPILSQLARTYLQNGAGGGRRY